MESAIEAGASRSPAKKIQEYKLALFMAGGMV
jgi:hypothetical protein